VTEERRAGVNKIIAGIASAVLVSVGSNYLLVNKSLTEIKTELIYIRKSGALAQENTRRIDKSEGFIQTTNFRLSTLENKYRELVK
jgi:hypothetical protein